ncbi:MAG: DUF1800 domain-containing protein, partial [Pseudomonadota bacterium]
VSHYAAARFADQASFGATPALVAEIESKSFSRWIDEQFALPASTLPATPNKIYDSNDMAQGERTNLYFQTGLYNGLINSPDQLRRRVSFALSQWVTVSNAKVDNYGIILYMNFLQEHAFGSYGTLVRDLGTNPAMGEYLDNLYNRPTSDECPACAPNENYARELMQLFTLGVVQLNQDGSTKRDAQGRPLESYQQKDVEELARALTGWNFSNTPQGFDHGRYEGKLIPDPWEPTHDRGAKTVLGTGIAAGGSPDADLDAAVAILMNHPNVAPFVSLRLIQHLVTSNPSAAYIARVAAVFKASGGDMKALVKAVLLDTEARRGDVLGADSNSFGKMREPVLWYTGLLRGLACASVLKWHDTQRGTSGISFPNNEQAFNAASVFSFYVPTDRAPGSNLLAPEQRLLNSTEMSTRLGGFGLTQTSVALESQCDTTSFGKALAVSPTVFSDLVSERFFRGAMPAVLRQNLADLAAADTGGDVQERAIFLLLYALSTPYYGVLR